MPEQQAPRSDPDPVASSCADRSTRRRRRLVLLGCLVATCMAAAESTIVATAVPTIVGELGDFSLFTWVFSAFLGAQALTIPIAGRLADAIGRKLVLQLGTGLFLLGSLLCGFAPSMAWLVLFRALQGLGAGGIQPIIMTICGDICAPRERARMQGLVSCVFGVAAVAGPGVGAILVEHGSWPLIFWIPIPAGLLAVATISLFLREVPERRGSSVDAVGAVLLACAMGALNLLLVQGADLSTAQLCGAAALAAAALLGLARRTGRVSQPILPVELWRDPVVAIGTLGNALVSAAMMAVIASLPAFVQGPMGFDVVASGSVTALMSVTWAGASFLVGPLAPRLGTRGTALLGTVAMVAGSLALLQLEARQGLFWAVCGSVAIGFGMGLCNTAFVLAAQDAVGWGARGAATASCAFGRFMGQVCGAAFAGAIVNLTGSAPASLEHLASGGRVTRSALGLPPVAASLETGLHNTYWAALALSLAALAAVRCFPRARSREPALQAAVTG